MQEISTTRRRLNHLLSATITVAFISWAIAVGHSFS